jgi:hypothetical protein
MKPRGKDPAMFPTAFAYLAARAVRSGRRVAGMVKAGDVMNEINQRRRGFVVGKLPDFSTLIGNPLEDALRDNSQSNVPIKWLSDSISLHGWRLGAGAISASFVTCR